MRDDFPNQIHMFLCALIPLSVILLLHKGFHLPFGVAVVFGLTSGVIAMLTIAPLTFWIYRSLDKNYDRNAVCHTTDAGCASLVFVLVIILIYSTVTMGLERREKNRKKHNAMRQYKMNVAE